MVATATKSASYDLYVEKSPHIGCLPCAAALLKHIYHRRIAGIFLNKKMSIMKTVITIVAIVFTGFLACDTPEQTTTNQGDTTSINSARPDTLQSIDTTMRRDTIPQ